MIDEFDGKFGFINLIELIKKNNLYAEGIVYLYARLLRTS